MNQELLPPSVRALLARGALFEGKYKLLRPLGEGSFASVLHARHEAMDREVALKFLRSDVMKAHPEVGERFMTEVRLASRLTSPHTVTIFDFGRTEEGVPYMVLEYVRGKTLDYAIEKYGGLGLKRSIRVALQILESLEEAHANNIIHRDLKPANIMVGKGLKKERGKRRVHAKVLDFGVAKLVEQSEEGLRSTESGRQSTQFIGTPRYMSPEQILGKEVKPASDLYSLGLIFYEMCTGLDSVGGDNVAKVAQAHLAEEPLELEGLAELPSVLQSIVRRATARHSKDRFQSAAEFREALEEAVELGKRKNVEAKTVAAVADGGPQKEKKQKAKERRSDVFSGRGYVELPEEAVEPRRPSTGAGVRPPTPSTRQATPRHPSPRPGGAGGAATPSKEIGRPSSGTLDLDMDTVEQQKREIARKRHASLKRQRQAERDNGKIWRWTASLTVIAVATFLSFVLVGGAMGALALPMRFGIALLPAILALLWAVFSETNYQDTLRGVIKPWAQRSVLMVLVSLAVLAVIMPDAARRSLLDDPLWFMNGWPDALRASGLAILVELICDGAAWLLGLMTHIIPWSP